MMGCMWSWIWRERLRAIDMRLNMRPGIESCSMGMSTNGHSQTCRHPQVSVPIVRDPPHQHPPVGLLFQQKAKTYGPKTETWHQFLPEEIIYSNNLEFVNPHNPHFMHARHLCYYQHNHDNQIHTQWLLFEIRCMRRQQEQHHRYCYKELSSCCSLHSIVNLFPESQWIVLPLVVLNRRSFDPMK